MSKAISKSQVRAMKCETHYAEYYLEEGSPLRRVESSELGTVGTQFHAYRAAYIHHLQEAQLARDPAWIERELKLLPVLPEARKMIDDDVRFFQINPQTIEACELFLSIDTEMRPLEMRASSRPGEVSQHVDALVSGTIDQLDIDGTVAHVTDVKSGWSTSSVTDDEPPIYAGLVFAHYPSIETVEFAWEFPRWRLGKSATYTRADLPWIRGLIESAYARRADIEKRWARGEDLKISAVHGLCSFCALRCPLRAAVQAGNVAIPPVQSLEDARAVASLHIAATDMAERTREALRAYADEHGPTDLGGGYVLQIEAKDVKKRPLAAVMRVLGYDTTFMGAETPRYAVPVHGITIGGLSSYAKAKKRAGLKEELDEVSESSPRTYVTVKRQSYLPAPSDEDDRG